MKIPRPLMSSTKSTTTVEKSTVAVEKPEEVSGREFHDFSTSEYIKSQTKIQIRQLLNSYSESSDVSATQVGFRVASVIAKYIVYPHAEVKKVGILSNETTYSGYLTYCEESGESIVILNEEKELSQFFGQVLQDEDDYEFPYHTVRMFNCDLSKVIISENVESSINRKDYHVWKNKEEDVVW